MYAAIPLYGTFAVFDPLRAPMPVIVPGPFAIAIGIAMLLAAAICVWGAFRRPVPRRIAFAQLVAGGATVLAALLGFDPGTGIKLGIIVLAMGAVGIAVYGYSPLPGVTRAIVIATLASGTLAALAAFVMLVTRAPAALYAYDNGRATGIFLNPNELAAYLLVVLGLAAGVVLAARSRGLRILAGITLIAGLLAFGATYSRWGFAAAACGALFYAVAVGGRRTWIGSRRGGPRRGAAADRAGPSAAPQPARRLVAPRRVDDGHSHVARVSAHRHRSAGLPPHLRCGPAARSARRQRTGRVRSAQPAARLFRGRRLDEHGRAAVRVGGLRSRDSARAARCRPAPASMLACAVAAGLVALNVHVLVNTISIYFPLATEGLALALALAQRDLDALPA